MDRPIHFSGDEIVHDRELDIVTVRGSVVATQGQRRLTADAINYNIKQDIVSASGSVTLVEPTGEILHAEYMELTGDFAAALAKDILYITADRSRMAALAATRTGNNRTDFDKAVYTACEPCREHPERSPLWQAKAERVTHDQANQTVEYRNAWIEFMDVPVLYTPYISTPDPTVKRRSGFLTPTISGSASVGQSLTTPYYGIVSKQEDFTLYPRWMLTQLGRTTQHNSTVDGAIFTRLLLGIQHRWSGEHGAVENIGSITEDPHTGKVRGQVNANGILDLTETWRAGYQILRQSDDTYAQVYGYNIPGDKPWLTSRAYGEGFWREDYALIESFSFQGITTGTDAPTQSPWVAPHAMFSHISSPGRWGDTWTETIDSLSYMREAGVSANRMSNELAWNLPYRDAIGEDWKFVSSVRTDGYRADGMTNYGSTMAGRAVPTVSLNWKYPFANSSTNFPQIITPMGMVAASPNWGNDPKIPNEDSIDYELDDTSIMRPNRLPGLDRIENNVRGAYGIRWTGLPYRGGTIMAQFAQGWRAHHDSVFSSITGFNGDFSDYVGRVTFAPGGNLQMTDRFRLDRTNLSAKRNEATISAGPAMLSGSIQYYYFEKSGPEAPAAFGRRQQLYYSLSSQISRYWSITGTYQTDLSQNGGPIGWGGTVTYDDDCFALVGRVLRNFTYSNDYLAGLNFSVNIVFKTFGQVPYTVFSN